eukprot:4212230-Amphidinium_carterae.1
MKLDQTEALEVSESVAQTEMEVNLDWGSRVGEVVPTKDSGGTNRKHYSLHAACAGLLSTSQVQHERGRPMLSTYIAKLPLTWTFHRRCGSPQCRCEQCVVGRAGHSVLPAGHIAPNGLEQPKVLGVS